jgi:hypothetical protein
MKNCSLCIVALGVLSAVGFLAVGSSGQDARSAKRSAFMRQKLEFSKNILEGLAREDYSLIAKNAKALTLLSQASEWEVETIPDVEQYVPYTTEFQRLTADLTKNAKAKNLDGATLAYVQLTMSCVKCHKFVRDGAK